MRNFSGFLKGMATGIAVGAAVTMITDPISDRDRKRIVKKTEGIFNSIGTVIDAALDALH